MNGAVEAANKNVKKIIAKATKTYKNWHEKLPFALHAYRTGIQTSTGATLYSLVYGMEAVLPIEVEILSLRVLKEIELEEAEWAQARYEQLNLIEEKRMKAICHGQLYQKRMMKAHDKKIWPRQFQEGELVLKRILQNRQDPRGKWSPNWEGPYVVKKAFLGGALILTEMDGKEFPGPINANIVKKYYAWSHQKKDLSDLKIRKGEFGKKKKGFKVKTRKGSLNHKKWKMKRKVKKENVRLSWKPERAAGLRKWYLDWKPKRAV